jgi:phosphoribosylformylglycinamidine synthase
LRNGHLEYRCEWTNLLVDTTDSRFTSECEPGQVLRIPISHGDGNYFADPETLAEIKRNDQILFRYSSPEGEVSPEFSPNGSMANIAGIVNRDRNVLGMMPHPERCCEAILGGEDGKFIFGSMLSASATGVSA